MGKDKNNVVMLVGVLQDPTEEVLTIDGQPAYVVRASVLTDLAVYGGGHRVLFTGQWAMRVMAHWQASRAAQSELELTVHGWLRSTPDESMVICERASFLVARRVHAEAMRVLNEHAGGLSGPTQREYGRGSRRS